jgi:hypothetical protein
MLFGTGTFFEETPSSAMTRHQSRGLNEVRPAPTSKRTLAGSMRRPRLMRIGIGVTDHQVHDLVAAGLAHGAFASHLATP